MRKVLVATDKPFAKPAVEGIAQVFQEAGYELVMLENYKDKQATF
jgi:D-3-phosphoglycerate dehydrogenase / 2-oxoglutarate reductase